MFSNYRTNQWISGDIYNDKCEKNQRYDNRSWHDSAVFKS